MLAPLRTSTVLYCTVLDVSLRRALEHHQRKVCCVGRAATPLLILRRYVRTLDRAVAATRFFVLQLRRGECKEHRSSRPVFVIPQIHPQHVIHVSSLECHVKLMPICSVKRIHVLRFASCNVDCLEDILTIPIFPLLVEEIFKMLMRWPRGQIP